MTPLHPVRSLFVCLAALDRAKTWIPWKLGIPFQVAQLEELQGDCCRWLR